MESMAFWLVIFSDCIQNLQQRKKLFNRWCLGNRRLFLVHASTEHIGTIIWYTLCIEFGIDNQKEMICTSYVKILLILRNHCGVPNQIIKLNFKNPICHISLSVNFNLKSVFKPLEVWWCQARVANIRAKCANVAPYFASSFIGLAFNQRLNHIR